MLQLQSMTAVFLSLLMSFLDFTLLCLHSIMAFCTWWFSSLAFPVGALAELHSEVRNTTNLPDQGWGLPFLEQYHSRLLKQDTSPLWTLQ